MRCPPLGVILFSRNIDNPRQVTDLVADFRICVGRPEAPVLIDQEGGRVARLRPPHWRHPPPAAAFAALQARDPAAARRAARLNARLIAEELRALGITVNCAPVLDLLEPGASDVIGDRAFGSAPRSVASLARAVIRGLRAGGIVPVLKHVPGHGRAAVDSHHALPVVEASREEILRRDAAPFTALAGEGAWAMTAHILYRSLDPDRPATLSPLVLRFVRRAIGLGGPLISDDLAMKALSGDPARLVAAAIAAGCDAVLDCSGDFARTEALLAAAPPLAPSAARRFAEAAQRSPPPARRFDSAAAEAALARLMA